METEFASTPASYLIPRFPTTDFSVLLSTPFFDLEQSISGQNGLFSTSEKHSLIVYSLL